MALFQKAQFQYLCACLRDKRNCQPEYIDRAEMIMMQIFNDGWVKWTEGWFFAQNTHVDSGLELPFITLKSHSRGQIARPLSIAF